ncbi:RAMP superfamily CRISPR-associated protein [Streptomyces aidingensis]|uniref:CRISPR/Cas system CSM-associated protein Csm3, group 7 of RAMP superfamily n=1 Tax=Streptomyces aidingensis TaxID=910347 RepID=A0A1I1NI48_9ACTN|nr:CRISPR/Cas system CSM-associated protein Csm3, group 7 of RAMP superfamily [Streptomyces aidingensis]
MTGSPSPDPSAGDGLTVRIDFHGPFRIATGLPGRGAGTTVDLAEPLPASSLKGLMRASARVLLPATEAAAGYLDQVFGSAAVPSPWQWTGARFPEDHPPAVVGRARIAIDSGTGTVRRDHLLLAEELWPQAPAVFTVTRGGHLPPGRAAEQLTVLACAAAGVHALGGSRRRGLGWVTCTPVTAGPGDGSAVDDALLDRFENLRSRLA